MKYLLKGFIGFLVLASTYTLHLTSVENQQYDALLQQQLSFQDKMNSIKLNMTRIRNDLEDKSIDEKVDILESAIKTERQSIYEASKLLVKDQSQISDHCQILSDEEKGKIESQINNIEEEIGSLKQLSDDLPESDELTAIQVEIEKQKLDIKSMNQILNTPCETHFINSPTVYQTNLLSQDWVLGSSQMQDLINEYIERANIQSNITNCQEKTPFYDGSQCISCPEHQQYFDISSKQCIKCEDNFGVNRELKKCLPVVKNSNFEIGNNYILQPQAYLPLPDQKQPYCPDDKPFYNGTFCQQCPLPTNYWKVQELKCETCPEEEEFNVNSKQCALRQQNKLTVLFGPLTNWVTDDGNTTRVLEQRQKILEENKTRYSQCPQISPYYDGLSCIPCEHQFNIDTLLCSEAPEGKKYNRNIRQYVTPVTSKQTDPNAKNYISLQPLSDNELIQNCDQATPFFDSIACIQCLQPFPIFDVNNNECITCDAVEVYDEEKHSCEKRQWIFAGGNEQGLMATEGYSYEEYRKQIGQALKNSPQSLAVSCEIQQQYAAISKCVGCEEHQYFNIETKQCGECDGHIDEESLLCIEQVRYLTNLDGEKILYLDTDEQAQSKSNEQLLEQHPRWEYCSLQQPYANTERTICFSCPKESPVYNYTSQACVSCEGGYIFVSELHICQKWKYQTNLDASLLIASPDTIFTYQERQKRQGQGFFIEVCPEDKPYTYDGKECFSCDNPSPVFNVTDNLCTSCPSATEYMHSTYSCKKKYYLTDTNAERILQFQNYTVQNIQQQQQQIKQDYLFEECYGEQPFGTQASCTNCYDQNSYFNLKTLSCQYCPRGSEYWPEARHCLQITYVVNLDADVKLIGQGDNPIEEKRQEIVRKKKYGPVYECPYESPYSINNVCQECTEQNPYFSLLIKECTHCAQNYVYSQTSYTCEKLYYLTNMQKMDNYIVNSTDDLQDMKNKIADLQANEKTQVCPQDRPYSSGKEQCFNCEWGKYMYIVNLTCIECNNYQQQNHTCPPKQPRYPNLSNYNWVIHQDNADSVIIKTLQLHNVDKARMCEAFYDWENKDCLTCQEGQYFSYDTFKCEVCTKPQVFNINTHVCAVPQEEGVHYTNIQQTFSPNLLYGGLTIGQLTYRSESLKQKYPSVEYCSEQNPYFDGKQCVDCPTYKKYFNLRYKLCQVCLFGQTLDRKSHNCLDQNGAPVWAQPKAQLVYPFLFTDHEEFDIPQSNVELPQTQVAQ